MPTYISIIANNVLVVALTFAALIITSNPLTVIGLYFMQRIPVIVAESFDHEGSEEIDADGAEKQRIGFM